MSELVTTTIWDSSRLSDLTTIRYGKSLDKSLRNGTGDFPVVGSAGVMAKTAAPLVSSPCIVVGRKGNVGAVQSFPGGCYPIDTVYYFEAPVNLEVQFLSLYLESQELKNLDSSTAIPSIRREDLDQVEVPLPPLVEQQRIVEILEEQFSRLDAALASIRTVRVKAKAFRQSLLLAAFSGSLSNESVKFEPVPLQDLVDAKADITDGPFGSNLKSEHYTTSGPRVVRLANIGSGRFINSIAHISTEHFATLQKHRVLAGDVLVATLGESIPRACIAPEYLGDAIVKADCIRIRPSRRVTSSFLSYAINSPVVRASAASMIQGVTRPRINLGTLRTTVIPLPPLEEQYRIAELIEEQFSRLDDALEITNQLEFRIASERRSLLHAAFSGTLTAQWRETHHG